MRTKSWMLSFYLFISNLLSVLVKTHFAKSRSFSALPLCVCFFLLDERKKSNVHMHAHMHACMHAGMQMHTLTDTHIHTHTCTHTHIHTHTQTQRHRHRHTHARVNCTVASSDLSKKPFLFRRTGLHGGDAIFFIYRF